jgi:hypothetical protein
MEMLMLYRRLNILTSKIESKMKKEVTDLFTFEEDSGIKMKF